MRTTNRYVLIRRRGIIFKRLGTENIMIKEINKLKQKIITESEKNIMFGDVLKIEEM